MNTLKLIPQTLTVKKDTKGYTLQDIEAEAHECALILASLGYHQALSNEYRFNFMDKVHSLGLCTKKRFNFGSINEQFVISINKTLVQTCGSEAVHNVIMHEMIHSLPGCMNHGPTWKNIAHLVNQYYDFTPITRLNNYSEYVPAKAKYKIVCEGCGAINYYAKMTNIVRRCITNTNVMCSCCKQKKFVVYDIKSGMRYEAQHGTPILAY